MNTERSNRKASLKRRATYAGNLALLTRIAIDRQMPEHAGLRLLRKGDYIETSKGNYVVLNNYMAHDGRRCIEVVNLGEGMIEYINMDHFLRTRLVTLFGNPDGTFWADQEGSIIA